MEVSPSTFKVEASPSEVDPSPFKVDPSTSEVEASPFEVQGSTSEGEGDTFEVEGSTSVFTPAGFLHEKRHDLEPLHIHQSQIVFMPG